MGAFVQKLRPDSVRLVARAEHVMVGNDQIRGHEKAGRETFRDNTGAGERDQPDYRPPGLQRLLIGRQIDEIESRADHALRRHAQSPITGAFESLAQTLAFVESRPLFRVITQSAARDGTVQVRLGVTHRSQVRLECFPVLVCRKADPTPIVIYTLPAFHSPPRLPARSGT